MDDVNESSSSDRLIQAKRSPSSNSTSDHAPPPIMASNDTESSKKLLVKESAQETPKSLELDENHRQPTCNSLKNWVRLASFEKSDLSPSSKSISSIISNTASANSNIVNSRAGDDKMTRDDDSRTSDGTTEESPTKKSLLWKGKNKLSLPGLQNDGSSVGHSSGHGSDVTPGQRFLSAAMAVHASVRLSRLERAKRRAKWAGKKILVFMLSNIGLIIVMLLYATAGGFLFRWLERDVSQEKIIAPSTQEQVGQKTEREVAPPLAEIHLEKIRDKYVQMMWNETVSLNVLHPASWSGSVSGILQEFEAKVYQAIIDAVANASGDGANGGAAFKEEEVEEKWTIPASLLFSTTVITSIGYGDITPKTTAGKLVCIPFAMVGIPLTLLTLANIGQLMAGSCRFAWRRLTKCGRLCGSQNDKKEDKKCAGKTRVPISVSICIMMGYILLGALIFSSWEKGWSFLDGFYFSFITLSTIGFGDLVPGQYERTSNERRVVCVLYLLIGLALLSMVFQLMVDSVMEVVEKFAKIFGLSKEQIEEEIEGIDETTNPVPNLILPPKSTHSISNNHRTNNHKNDAPQFSGKDHITTDNKTQSAENMV